MSLVQMAIILYPQEYAEVDKLNEAQGLTGGDDDAAQTNGEEYRTIIQPSRLPTAEKRIDSDCCVEGYATTFNKPYLLYEWDGVEYYEEIDRHALDGADLSDVIMQYDHHGKVLARLSNKTLGLEPNDNGLFIYADLSKSQAAKELYEEIRNGLVTKMSGLVAGQEQKTRPEQSQN